MAEGPFYLVEYNDPVLVGCWGRRTAEVVEEFPTEEEAWTELRRLKNMLRFAGTGCSYYGVSQTRPPAPDPTPLRPFDPADAGECLEEEPGVGYPGGGQWDDDA